MSNTLRIRVSMLSLGIMCAITGCSKEEASPVGTQISQDAKSTPATQDKLKSAWETFTEKVEKGEWKDAFGQYVSKSTWVESNGEERPIRPKKDATTREFKRVTKRNSAGDITSMLVPIDEPCGPETLDCGGGGGGGYTPPNYTFVTTEDVQPSGSSPGVNSPSGTAARPTGFYTTENPNGYLYDIKIVKGRGSSQPPFDGFRTIRYYHNINVDLNKGAGGEYIYVSFTRDPSYVIYQRNGSCGDEQPKDNTGAYTSLPITSVDTRVVGNTGTLIKCFNGYTPMWADNPLGSFEGNYMKFPDLNDGAGGSYVYGYQSRNQSYGTPIELGILTGNNVNIQPPAGSGYTRVGSDLNSGAGGDYIFFCIKRR